MTDGLRSGQLAAAAGVSTQTLRYYERRGLLAEPARTLGGHRLYPGAAVTVLRLIKTAQRLGFTLDEIARLLRAGRGAQSGPAAGGLHGRAAAKLREIESRIAELEQIATTLRAALLAGCDNLAECGQADPCPLPPVDPGGPARMPPGLVRGAAPPHPKPAAPQARRTPSPPRPGPAAPPGVK